MQKHEIKELIDVFDELDESVHKRRLAYVIRGAVNDFLGLPVKATRDKLTEQEIELLKTNHKVQAVKSVRDRTNWTLMRSLKFVNKWGKQYLPQ